MGKCMSLHISGVLMNCIICLSSIQKSHIYAWNCPRKRYIVQVSLLPSDMWKSPCWHSDTTKDQQKTRNNILFQVAERLISSSSWANVDKNNTLLRYAVEFAIIRSQNFVAISSQLYTTKLAQLCCFRRFVERFNFHSCRRETAWLCEPVCQFWKTSAFSR
jgi:hypothetical protein